MTEFEMKMSAAKCNLNLQFLDKDEKWSVANKATFIKFFPTKQKQINDYLTSHSVNFKSKSDLLKLLTFCRQL